MKELLTAISTAIVVIDRELWDLMKPQQLEKLLEAIQELPYLLKKVRYQTSLKYVVSMRYNNASEKFYIF